MKAANRLCLAGSLAACSSVSAVIIQLTPSDIHGNDTTTAFFTNGEITLTPTRGGTSEGITFNASADNLGIDGFAGTGENPNAFSEADNVFGNGNEEGLNFEFPFTSGLTQVTFNFSSFGGTRETDGLQISGFRFDPQASLSGAGSAIPANNVTFANGVLTVIFSGSFGGENTELNLANPAASAGVTLVATVGDGLTSIAQWAVTGISYENEVPSDRDGDMIPDDDELALGGDPDLFDTDGDGFSDLFERDAGTALDDPSSNSGPPASGRESIGVTFTSSVGDAPNRGLSPLATVGADGFVQRNWNSTEPLPAEGIYTELDIATPSADTLVDSAGLATGVTFTTEVTQGESALNRVFSVNNDRNQPISGLLSGYVFANTANPQVSVNLSNIPYPRYDIVIYGVTNTGTASEEGALAVFDGFSDDSALLGQLTLSSAALTLAGDAPNLVQSFDQSAIFTGRGPASENFPRANYVVLRGLTGTEAALQVSFVSGNFGIAAFQIVAAPDSDGDGLGDAYETTFGLNPADNGDVDSAREGALGDFDGDGLSNQVESNRETHPGLQDSDGDGLLDPLETDTGVFVNLNNRGTDPNVLDSDRDGLTDTVETATGVYVSLADTGTNPSSAVEDSDGDAFPDAFEILNAIGEPGPFDATIPGGPNPTAFAVAFNASNGQGNAANVTFPGTVTIGAPGVEQRNWNRTAPQGTNVTDGGLLATFGSETIISPTAGQLVDSSGAPLSGVVFSYAPGSGVFSINNSGILGAGDSAFVGPFGRLFNSYAFGSTNPAAATPESRVTFSNIPYASYDAYVYFGSFTPNNGTVSNFDGSGVALETFSYVTVRSALTGSQFLRTETAEGNPQANFAVFENQTAPDFDVRTNFAATAITTNIGIFGVQIVETIPEVELLLANPARAGSAFTASFTASVSGDYQLQRSLTLEADFVNIGEVITATAGQAIVVSDAASPPERAFYRVVEVGADS